MLKQLTSSLKADRSVARFNPIATANNILEYYGSRIVKLTSAE
jgi:hypothetical protein